MLQNSSVSPLNPPSFRAAGAKEKKCTGVKQIFSHMSKIIYFIRHAKSSWDDYSLKDIDRPLNSRGKRDAPKMARYLIELSVQPDIIVIPLSLILPINLPMILLPMCQPVVSIKLFVI